MAGDDPSEDQEVIQPSNAAQVAERYQALSDRVSELGQTVIFLQTNSMGKFPSQLNTAFPKIGQGLTDIGLRLHGVAASAQQQALMEQAYLPAHTEAVVTLKAAKQAVKSAQAVVDSGSATPEQVQNLTSAKQAEDAVRQHLHKVWDNGATEATQYAQPIPAHGTEAQAAAQRASDAKIVKLSDGGQAMPDSVQQIVPSKTTAPRVETPAANKGIETKPSSEKPSTEKNSVDGANSQTPQQGQQGLSQAPGVQQGQGQQQGGAQPAQGAPAGTAPSGSRATTGVPVSQPAPIRSGENSGRGGGVRQTPSNPVQSPAARAGLAGAGGKGGTALGSGSSATGAGGITPATANKGGGAPSSSSGSSSTSNTARGPMGGGAMGGGAGHGAGGGGTARPKAEVKNSDPRLTGEDVAAEAIGGVYREGDPVPPTAPSVPVTETPPVPPTPPSR